MNSGFAFGSVMPPGTTPKPANGQSDVGASADARKNADAGAVASQFETDRPAADDVDVRWRFSLFGDSTSTRVVAGLQVLKDDLALLVRNATQEGDLRQDGHDGRDVDHGGLLVHGIILTIP